MRKPRKINPNAVYTSHDIVYDLEEIREWKTGKTGDRATRPRYIIKENSD